MSTTTLVPEKTQFKKSHFRPDIQGLRAIAVLIVLVFHAGDGVILPGGYVGVDIFFVISGFLITGHLLRTSIKFGKIDLIDFYARRVLRILPAATLVLFFTAISTLIILPATRWESISTEILASSFYLVNWVFAANTNYLNADAAASPIQHYWTLAVEEQFYIVWPALLIVLLWRLNSKLGPFKKGRIHQDRLRLITRQFAWGAILLTVVSFVWSIYYSALDPAPAYFVTTTRIWELGIGAIAAVFVSKLEKLPNIWGYFFGVAGFVLILIATFFYDSSTVFPGYAALLPTLGALGILVGGMSGRAETGIGVLLTIRPMRWVGDLSYSLYLWHWPLIVIGTHLLGGTITLWQGLAIVAISFLPAWLSYRFVENPLRSWPRVKNNSINALKMGVILMAISVASSVLVLVATDRTASNDIVQAPNLTSESDSGNQNGESNGSLNSSLSGAEALAQDPTVGQVVDKVTSYYPPAASASMDNPKSYSKGCHQEFNETAFEPCVFGDEDSDYVVALIGDSHAAQWLPALEPIAIAQGWRLEIYTKSSCPFIGTAVSAEGKTFYSECYEWNENAIKHLTGPDAPDYVITSSALHGGAEVNDGNVRTGSIAEGYSLVWNQLKQAGVPVTVLMDTPRPRIDVPECVAANNEQLSKCAVPREEAMRNGSQQQMEAVALTNISSVDLTDSICPGEVCAAIVGEVL